jgi:potassium-dependent mechanosensitive channel
VRQPDREGQRDPGADPPDAGHRDGHEHPAEGRQRRDLHAELSFNNDGPLGTFFRYIGDTGTYIARYDDLFTGKDEKIDVSGSRVDERHRAAGPRVLRRHPRGARAQRQRGPGAALLRGAARSWSSSCNASRGREVQALSDAVQALREFEDLARGQESLWRSRREMLAPDVDLGQRRAQATTWNGLLEALGKRLRRLSDEIRLSRSELRAQQAQVANQPADDPTRAAEQQTLVAFQLRLDLQERLHEGLEGAVVLVTRARSDLGFDVGPSDARGWLEYLVATAGDGFGSVWNYELFSATETLHLDGRPVTVEHGVTIGKSVGMLVLFAVGYWAAGALSRRLIQLMSWRLQLSAQLARVLRRWLNAILVLVVLLVVLKLARIPITAFAFLGGALAIGVGFGAQNVIKNLISGIIILFERKIRVGDIVAIGGMAGTVVTVDLRATTVRGFDGIDAIVPNSILLENQISNWSGGSPEMRRTIAVGVAYGSDLRRAARIIADCAGAHPSVLQLPVPEVLFDDFGNDNLSFKLQYWMRLGGPHGGPAIDSDLRFAIAEGLEGAGIVIAFPQRDVHLDAAAPLRVQIVGGSPPGAG